jgi:stage II sporulation protein D
VPVEPLPPAEPAPPPLAPLGQDLLLRVGLLSDQARVVLPCCARELRASVGGRTWATVSAVAVEPAPEGTVPGIFRVQIAALRDPGQAEALASRIGRVSGEPADAVLDAATGFYRVRVGRHSTREAAEVSRRALARHGVTEGWVVGEGGGVRAPALRVVQDAQSTLVPGRWLAVEAPEGGGIPVAGHRYRGRILLYLNDRGTLNVVNELPLEDYLRGVVPRELGPEAYPELEALKAQAVAARTYTVRNLGEFRQEGFDICATPRCQVYGGMDAEHPRSDRAVAESRGQVLLFHEQPIDALYSSTCGGHTEDVEVVFPLKREPYLRGVPCVEAGVAQLGGTIAGDRFPDAVAARLLPPVEEGAAGYRQRLLALAALAGLPAPPAALPSLDAAAVRRFVAGVFDLALDARLFVAPEDLAYLVASPPPGWGEVDRRLAALFVKAGLAESDPAELDAAAREELLFRLALYLQVLRQEEGRYLGMSEGRLRVRVGEEDRELAIPAELATFRRRGDEITGGELALVPGDRIDLVWQGDSLMAVIQQVHPQGAANDRTSRWASWRRFKSDRELSGLVQQRYPGFPYRSFEVVTRGVSGRVGELRLLGDEGRTERVEGLAVRWTLDLPDTLFTAKRLAPNRGESGWLFSGRGLGHGVGMCQVGAYGMAVRGHAYHEILGHYYRGVRLGAIPASVATGSVAGLWVPVPEPVAAERAAVPVPGPVDAGDPAATASAPVAGATR